MPTKPKEPINMSEAIEEVNKLIGEVEQQQKSFETLLSELGTEEKKQDTSASMSQVISTIKQMSENYQKLQKDLSALESRLTDIPPVQTSISRMQSSLSRAQGMIKAIMELAPLLEKLSELPRDI